MGNNLGVNRIGKGKCYNNLSFKHFFVISHSNSLYFFRILGSMSAFLLFYSLFTVLCQMAKKKFPQKGRRLNLRTSESSTSSSSSSSSSGGSGISSSGSLLRINSRSCSESSQMNGLFK